MHRSPVRWFSVGLLAFTYSGCVLYLELASQLVLYLYYAAAIGCSVHCLSNSPRGQMLAKKLSPYAFWYALFAVWLLGISFLTQDSPRFAWDVVRDSIHAVTAWLLVLAVATDLKWLRRAVAAISVILIGNAIVSIMTPTSPNLFAFILRTTDVGLAERYGHIARPGGLWGNANQAGHAFFFGFLLLLWFPCLLSWLGQAACVVGIYLSASRQANYLLVLAAFTLVLYFFPKRRYLLAGTAIFVAFAATALWVQIEPTDLLGADRFERVLDSRDLQMRVEILQIAADRLGDAPLYGAGPYVFRRRLGDSENLEHTIGAHNIYLAILGEGGPIMLLSYVGVLLIGLRRAVRSRLSGLQRLSCLSFWVAYCIIGFTWHEQLGDFGGQIYVALLYVLPAVGDKWRLA